MTDHRKRDPKGRILPVSGWRKIETAPKDGNHVLLYRPYLQFVGYYADAGWCVNAPGVPLIEPTPTHWQHLPKPPQGDEA